MPSPVTPLAIGALVFLSGSHVVSADVEVGNPAPAFSATDTRGKPQSLESLRGKYVVLEWVNPECPFVKKHYDTDNMQQLQRDYTGKGVVWLSVNSSAAGKQGHLTAERANAWVQDRKAAPTGLILDADGTIGRAYAAKTTPHLFIINPDGAVIYHGAIDDKPSTDKADVPGAHNYVRHVLDEALAGKPVTAAPVPPYGCSVKY